MLPDSDSNSPTTDKNFLPISNRSDAFKDKSDEASPAAGWKLRVITNVKDNTTMFFENITTSF
jgi:hypothetical protein